MSNFVKTTVKYKITVIMGVFNCAGTLCEAIDSLLCQSYSDFKIIICDDGSTDDTYAVAERYASRYDNIVLIKNEHNMGLNATLNRCLEYVDTEYVARMDADDISLPGRFEKQIGFLDSHPEYAFVSASMVCFDERGDFGFLRVKEGSPSRESFIRSTPFFHAPAMVRTDAYRRVGGYSVDRKLLRVEDYHLWFKMYAAGLTGYNISEPLYKVREDRNAVRRRNFRNRMNETYVKLVGYRMLKMPLRIYPFAFEPIVKGLVPDGIYRILHRRNLRP